MHAVAAVAFLLSFVASTSAYQILTPNATVPWIGLSAPQIITWVMADTDPDYFTIILTNQEMVNFPNQTLAAQVRGNTNTTVYPPNGDWIPGSNYRVDFVLDPNHLGTILAQSGDFNITVDSDIGSNDVQTTTPLTIATPTEALPTYTFSTSAIVQVSIPTSGATTPYPVQTGLLALFFVIAFALA